jgi:hypothetical protein
MYRRLEALSSQAVAPQYPPYCCPDEDEAWQFAAEAAGCLAPWHADDHQALQILRPQPRDVVST